MIFAQGAWLALLGELVLNVIGFCLKVGRTAAIHPLHHDLAARAILQLINGQSRRHSQSCRITIRLTNESRRTSLQATVLLLKHVCWIATW